MQLSAVTTTTEKIRPRQIVHRGHVLAAGFLLDPEMIGWLEAQRRVLSLWTPGTQVYQISAGLLVHLPAPVRVDCNSSIGLALTASGALLLGAPFTSNELKLLGETAESVVLLRAGSIVVEPIRNANPVRIESWLNVESYHVVKTTTLGRVQSRPEIKVEPPPLDIRAGLKDVPPESPELAGVLASFRSGRKSTEGLTGDELVRRAGATFLRAASGFFAFLGTPSFLSDLVNPGVRGPGLLSRFAAYLDSLAARLLMNTKLGRVLGRSQAKYIEKMLEMFESGDMTEALRHAIPLGGQGEADLRSLLGGLSPRDRLSINPGGTRTRRTINLGFDLLQHLRNMYRMSFERLEAQGRIEEAAFVLAELLKANEEAVAFLEKHGKLRLAAEIAEARDLPPGLIVRQWFVAGDRDRAIAIARRTHAFGDAIVRMERKDKNQAEVLRLLWATFLAETGQYANAVEVIWPYEAGRNLATKWLDQAIELGGPAAARSLARKVTLVPEAFEDTRARVVTLLEDESPETSDSRLAFTETLVAGQRTPQARTLVRPSIRSVIRDAGLGYQSIKPSTLRKFIDFAGNGALGADIKRVNEVKLTTLSMLTPAIEMIIGGSDIGTVAVMDASYLPNGRMIVALGEAGALLINSNGRTVAHFDQPVGRLVVSDHGDRAIAVARRGESCHLSKLDFMNRRGRAWCDVRLRTFAVRYDGSMWFIAEGEDFYAIDATSSKFDALWRVPDVGPTIAITRTLGECRLLTINSDGYEEWRYVVPQLKLLRRIQIPIIDEHLLGRFDGLLVDSETVPNQAFFSVVANAIEGDPPPGATIPADVMSGEKIVRLSLRLYAEGGIARELFLFNCAVEVRQIIVSSHWFAFLMKVENGCRLLLLDSKERQLRFNLLLVNAENAAIKIADSKLTVVDDKGRVVVIDLENGRVLRNLRISV